MNGIGAYEPEVFRQRAAAALAGAADAHAALESRLTVAKTLLRP